MRKVGDETKEYYDRNIKSVKKLIIKTLKEGNMDKISALWNMKYVRRFLKEILKEREIDLKKLIIKTLKEGKIERISALWDHWVWDILKLDDFKDLFELEDLNFTEKSLEAIHYHFRHKITDDGVSFLPLGVENKFQSEIKTQLKEIISKNEMSTFVPLFGYDLLSLFNKKEILSFILDPNINLLKKVLISFTQHDEELYFYHNIASELEQEVFKIAKRIDILDLQTVIVNIIKDSDGIDFSHLIKNGFIEKLRHEDLLEVLYNEENFKNFIKSLNNAYFKINYHEIPNYYVELGKKLSDSLKNSLINILFNSKTERAQNYYTYTPNTKYWDLPLTLRALGWYKFFKIEKLNEVLRIINDRYPEFKHNDYNQKFFGLIRHLENLIEEQDIGKLLVLVDQASEGKDNIEKGAVGSNGYGFVFKDTDCNIPYMTGILSSKFSSAGSFRIFNRMRENQNIFDRMRENQKRDLLLAGSLKTLVPSLQFGGVEILFDAWMFVKTPDNKFFPATFYYGASGLSVGGSSSNITDMLNKYEKESGAKIFPVELESIINFSPFNFLEEELNLFLDALEFALKKVPVSDFDGVYRHDLGDSYMGVRDGKPFYY